MKKVFYYYIDESGSLTDVKSDIFLVGCVVFDSYESNNRIFKELKDEISSNILFDDFDSKKGFHASEDDLSIFNKYIEKIGSFNFRAYIAFIDKRKSRFSQQPEKDYYKEAVFYIMYTLLMKRFNDNNLLYFEGRTGKREKEKKDLENLLENVTGKLLKNRKIKSEAIFNVSVVGKKCKYISIVDYIIYIVSHYLFQKRTKFYNKLFDLIKPKIALIIDMSDQNNNYISFRKNGKNSALF